MEPGSPLASCHEEELQALIETWEAKRSRLVSDIEPQGFMAQVHFDHEDRGCDCFPGV